jgi:hypothetical protein
VGQYCEKYFRRISPTFGGEKNGEFHRILAAKKMANFTDLVAKKLAVFLKINVMASFVISSNLNNNYQIFCQFFRL